MAEFEFDESEPCYVISIVAKRVGIHIQTLRYYEKMGVIQPTRSEGNIRLYSEKDIERLRKVKMLTDDLGVNLAGVDVILRMTEHMIEMEREMEQLREEIRKLDMR